MEKFLAESVIVLAVAALVIFTIAFLWTVSKKLKGELVFPCKKENFSATVYSIFSFAMSVSGGLFLILLTNSLIAGGVGLILMAGLSIWLLHNVKFQSDG